MSHPSPDMPHYQRRRFGPLECIDFTRYMSFCAGNAFKYVWRCEDKGACVEDLRKAIDYVIWSRDNQEDPILVGRRVHVEMLADVYLRPHIAYDWMARVLLDIIYADHDLSLEGITSRRAFFITNGGRP